MTTRYEQAMARVEEMRDFNVMLERDTDVYVIADKEKEQILLTLKAVLELHGPVDYENGIYLCDAEETCWGCAEWSATSKERSVCCQKFPCPTAEKIIEGVLGE